MRKISYAIWVCLMVLGVSLQAQNQHYGCPVTHESELEGQSRVKKTESFAFPEQQTAYVPVKHWVIASDNGVHDVKTHEFEYYMQLLNQSFASANIVFYTSEVEQYNNSAYTYIEYGSPARNELYEVIGNDNVINVFWTKTNGWSWAQFPNSSGSRSNIIVMNDQHDGFTFVHEFGHTFNLYHTFQGGNELVDGSNCEFTGDRVCDTPADPNNGGAVSSCQWVGSDEDANGDRYSPDVLNIMSYYGQCRAHFSAGQIARSRASLNSPDRYSLITDSIIEPNVITAFEGVASVDDNRIVLNWENSDSVYTTGFEIEKTVEGVKEIILIDGYVQEYIDTDVKTTKNYSYRIKSINKIGSFVISDELTVLYSDSEGCTDIQSWDSGKAYSTGAIVKQNNIQYKAKWWSQGNSPEIFSQPYDAWENVGSCTNGQVDAYALIDNLVDNQNIYFLPSSLVKQQVAVKTNNNEVSIDSVQFIITDDFDTHSNVRVVTSFQVPFNIEFSPVISSSTTIETIAYANGVAGDTKSRVISFTEPTLPTIDLIATSGTDGEKVWVHQNTKATIITPILNDSATIIDSVYYEIVHVFTNSADVEKRTLTSAPFELIFIPQQALRIEINSYAFDHWGRVSQISSSELIPKEYNPIVNITTPADGSTIDFNFDNVTPIQVDVTIENDEPIYVMPYIVYSVTNGERNQLVNDADITPPFGQFQFTPVDCDFLEIIAIGSSKHGYTVFDTAKVYVNNINANPSVTITSPTDGVDYFVSTPTVDVTVDVNDEQLVIDSVYYVVLNSLCVGPGCTEVTEYSVKEAPFTLELTPDFDANFTVIRAIAFSNGVASEEDQVTVSFKATPSVTITSPTDGVDYFVSTPTVDVTVDVNDEQLVIDSVYYVVLNSLCVGPGCTEVTEYSVKEAPFTLELTPNFDANFTVIRAIAFSNGVVSEEDQVTVSFKATLDTLILNSPTANGVLGSNKGYDFAVDLSGVSGTVTSVTYKFEGPYTIEQTVTAAPFDLEWGFTELGEFTAVATAITAEGGVVVSEMVTLTVVEPTPTAVITAPATNSTAEVGEELTFTIDATDLDGDIVSVEWYFKRYAQIPAVITSTDAPFTITWSATEEGAQEVFAVAYDNDGRTVTTETVVILITESTCSVDSWDAGVAYSTGDQVVLNGIVYEAKWWTLGNNPEQNSGTYDMWSNLGVCGSSSARIASANGVVEVTVTPNPVRDQLIITGNGTAFIYNAFGEKIAEYDIENELEISVSNWTSGIYMLKVGDADMIRFIKE